MNIRNFIPCSYTDFPGNVACVVELGNVMGYKKDSINESYVINYMRENRQWLDGVVIRGQEPTLDTSIMFFCKQIKALGFTIKLDTNGMGPQILKKLIEMSCVDYISMELKAPPEKYLKLTGTDFSKVKEAYRLVKSFKSHEFKTEVGDMLDYKDVKEIAHLTNREDYFLVPSQSNHKGHEISFWSRTLGVRYRETNI